MELSSDIGHNSHGHATTTANNEEENAEEEVEEVIEADQLVYHNQKDAHGRASRLVEIILGGQDGLVNALGVVLGVAAASSSQKIVLAGGLAAAFAESVSMGAVAFTSQMAEGEFYKSERARELRHIERVPNIERKETREIFRKMGFPGPLVEQILSQITKDPENWVEVMLRQEHGVQPVTRRDALVSAAFVFVAALMGSLIPLVPFFFTSPDVAQWISVGISAAALFFMGTYKSLIFRVGNWFLKGLELTIIGIASAMIGWGIGVAFDRLWE